jgi:dTDP-4-amino-4,6-dideoxygalactose transaminase
MNFNTVTEFENQVAEFFGAPYAVAVDACTHGVELSLRYTNAKKISVPKNTYLSIPFLFHKLNIELEWREEGWRDYYYVTDNVVDAAVLWRKDSYVPGTFMSLSFQYQKHLSLGRGGMILTDNKEAAIQLKKMSYDGRLPNIPWRDQNIDTIGYHYYMTPEVAQLGLEKLPSAKVTTPRQWTVEDWPDLSQMDVFKQTTNDLNTYCGVHQIDRYLQTK